MSKRLSSLASCAVCGADFHPRYVGKGLISQHCSKRCAYRARAVQRTCQRCGRLFTTNLVSRRTDYCSLACIERSPCLLCGKIITGRAKFQGAERRFCSRRCAAIVNRTMASKKKYVVLGFAATIKRVGALACEECGFAGVQALDIHHRNGDRSDNTDANLITLCANCHAAHHRTDRSDDVRIAHLIAGL